MDLLRCPTCGVNPHKTVSPPSPGHNRAVSTVPSTFPPFSTSNPAGNPDSLIALIYGVRSILCPFYCGGNPWGQVDLWAGNGCGWHEPTNPCFTGTGRIIYGDRSIFCLGTGRFFVCSTGTGRILRGQVDFVYPWGQVDFLERAMDAAGMNPQTLALSVPAKFYGDRSIGLFCLRVRSIRLWGQVDRAIGPFLVLIVLARPFFPFFFSFHESKAYGLQVGSVFYACSMGTGRFNW
jgi:hypothetical protein